MKKEAKTAGKKKEEKAETAAEKSFTKTNLTRGEILEMLAEYHKDVHEFVERTWKKYGQMSVRWKGGWKETPKEKLKN